MKKSILFILMVVLMTGATSCTLIDSLFSKTEENTNERLVGEWREVWAVGSASDVNYSDEYRIRLGRENDLLFYCKTHEQYKFQNISFNGKRLTFTIVNQKYKDAEPTLITYDMTINAEHNKLEGRAETSKGKKVKVRWDKTKTSASARSGGK